MSGYQALELDFRQAVSAVARAKGAVLVIGLVTAALGVGIHFLFPRPFTAVASFLPATSASMSSLTDPLHGMPFGIGAAASLLGGSSSASEIYPEVLASTRLLSEALERRPTPTAQPYVAQFGFRDPDSTRNLARAVRVTRAKLSVDLNRVNGVVTIRFKNRNPRLAASFLVTLLDCVNEFNTTTRQSDAGGVRKFLEKRTAEARIDLQHAEGALSDFKSRNLRFANAPRLETEESRLQRELRLAESVYQTLSQQYELARIDEARDIPTLTLIEPPRVPVIPTGLGLLAKATIGMLVGVLGSALWIGGKAGAKNVQLA